MVAKGVQEKQGRLIHVTNNCTSPPNDAMSIRFCFLTAGASSPGRADWWEKTTCQLRDGTQTGNFLLTDH